MTATAHSAGEHSVDPQPPRLPLDAGLSFAADMFKALADPDRLRLLARLADGETCVTELAALEDQKVTTVSARLKLLLGARLVSRRREAKLMYYRLTDDHVLQIVITALEHSAEDAVSR